MTTYAGYALHVTPWLLAVAAVFVGASGIDGSVAGSELLLYLRQDPALTPDAAILWDIRMPRIALALLVGAALSGAGATLQTLFKNPLVDPFLLGISAGAAFGCALSIGMWPHWPIQPLAFIGALLSAVIVLLLAQAAGGGRLALVLSGVVLSAFLTAATGLVKFFVEPQKLQSIVFWMMGSFSLADWSAVQVAGWGVLIGLCPLLLLRWRLNVLALSDDEARALGVAVEPLRLLAVVCTALATAFAVSVCGLIGWIGLLTPHIARLLVGADVRRLLPASLSLGAALMLIADTISRSLTQYDLPVGLVTALLGAPFFIVLLRYAHSGWTQQH